MTKYINKEAAIKAVKQIIGNQDHECKAMMDFYCALRGIPAADVAPVVHGSWEHTHTSESYFNECWRCSACGFDDTEGFDFKYCPNCGAKMDLEELQDE